MPQLHVRAAILTAMLTKAEHMWTRKELAEATGLEHTSIVKSCEAACRTHLLTMHTGPTHRSPVSYTLTHDGRQAALFFAGEEGNHGQTRPAGTPGTPHGSHQYSKPPTAGQNRRKNL